MEKNANFKQKGDTFNYSSAIALNFLNEWLKQGLHVG